MTTIVPGPAVTGKVKGKNTFSPNDLKSVAATDDFSALVAESLLFKRPQPIAAKTKPPATCTTGREIPKNANKAAPISSTTSRNRVVLIAILRARVRNTSGGATPTNPRNTSADPKGLIRGSRALNPS